MNALWKRIRTDDQFHKLLTVFSLEDGISEVAESMKVVYCVLKNEEKIMEVFNYNELLTCLREKKFFTKREEIALSKQKKEIKEIIEILKDKDLDLFKTFLLCCKKLKPDVLVTTMASLSDKGPSCIFRQYLQKRCTNVSFTQISEVDFNLPLSDDINIALIQISEEDHQKKSNFLDRYSVLLKQQANYTRERLNSYSDIVVENCRVILIQGYPGSGKTFLTKQMCMKWAQGELLNRFNHVIFLELRDKEVATAETFDKIIQLYMGPLAKGIIKQIYERNGKGILIILEGWDELPEGKRHSSIFTRLISGDLLPEVVIVITSRPSAIKSLQYKHIQRRIELLGFTEEQVEKNITFYFQKFTNASELVKKFYSELKRLPLLKCSIFVPINLCIALYIFNTSDYELPNTFTDTHKELVLNQLRRHQARKPDSESINTLENLPEEVDDMLLRLGKMAYEQLQNNLTLVFSEKMIKKYCFDSKNVNLDSFDGMGLLQVSNHRHFVSVIKTYEFIHRTLQELLAAWYLSQQGESAQKKQLQRLFNKNEFEMVLIFYGGLTKFKYVPLKDCLVKTYLLHIKMASNSGFSWFLKNIIQNKFIRFPGVGEIIDKYWCGKQYSHDLSCCISTEFQTTLIAAVFETQNPQLCKDMCESYLFNGEVCWFTIPESAATPHFLSALSYCIVHSGKEWMIQCRSFDENGANNILKYLTCCTGNNCSSTDGYICVFDTDCSQSPINGIPKLVHNHHHLQWLILSNSKHADDQFVAEVTEALENNTCLKMLHLVGCSVTSNGLRAIAIMLMKNKTLQWIGLDKNTLTLTEGDIIMLLEIIENYNDTVFMLFIDTPFYTSDKIQEKLQNLNFTRQQRKVQNLNLTLLDCFKFHETCQRIISNVSFMQNQVSL